MSHHNESSKNKANDNTFVERMNQALSPLKDQAAKLKQSTKAKITAIVIGAPLAFIAWYNVALPDKFLVPIIGMHEAVFECEDNIIEVLTVKHGNDAKHTFSCDTDFGLIKADIISKQPSSQFLTTLISGQSLIKLTDHNQIIMSFRSKNTDALFSQFTPVGFGQEFSQLSIQASQNLQKQINNLKNIEMNIFVNRLLWEKAE